MASANKDCNASSAVFLWDLELGLFLLVLSCACPLTMLQSGLYLIRADEPCLWLPGLRGTELLTMQAIHLQSCHAMFHLPLALYQTSHHVHAVGAKSPQPPTAADVQTPKERDILELPDSSDVDFGTVFGKWEGRAGVVVGAGK